MKRALAQLREKTDRDLAVLVRHEGQRARTLARHGHYIEAWHKSVRARAWLMVADVPRHERATLERLLDLPAVACA